MRASIVWSVLLFLPVALSGCCECTAHAIFVDITASDGDGARADVVSVLRPGATELEEVCTDCDSASVPVAQEGLHNIMVKHGEETVEVEVDVVFPEARGGECCSHVFVHEQTVMLPD